MPERRRRIIQIISDLAPKPLNTLRVLDLASLEGHYSLEFAARGCQVLGIEGRQSNIKIAEAEKRRLGFQNVEFVQDDVRNLSVEKYGTFDITLALGIMYHLEAEDAVKLINKIAQVCPEGIAIIDTHFSPTIEETIQIDGEVYAGKYYEEYEEDEPSVEKVEESRWSAIGNTKSFWFTRASLYNQIERAGFTSIYECHSPYASDYPQDRATLVACRGKREHLLNVESPPALMWPEVSVSQERQVSWLRARLYHLKKAIIG